MMHTETIQLLGQGEAVTALEVVPATVLVEVTDEVIGHVDQATWEGMASGPRTMNTNGQRIMGLVLETGGITLKRSIAADGSDIRRPVDEVGVGPFARKIIEAYPDINRPYQEAHDRKWGWDPRDDAGVVRDHVLRLAANTIRSAGLAVAIPSGITRKIPRSLASNPYERAPWFS